MALQLAVLVPASSPAPQKRQVSIALELSDSTIPGTADKVEVRTCVKNVSGHTIMIGSLGPDQDYDVIALGPDGKPAQRTALARRLQDPRFPQGGSRVEITLPPQESTSATWNLADLVKFAGPGKYRVAVARTFDTINERDVSNEITVAIQ